MQKLRRIVKYIALTVYLVTSYVHWHGHDLPIMLWRYPGILYFYKAPELVLLEMVLGALFATLVFVEPKLDWRSIYLLLQISMAIPYCFWQYNSSSPDMVANIVIPILLFITFVGFVIPFFWQNASKNSG